MHTTQNRRTGGATPMRRRAQAGWLTAGLLTLTMLPIGAAQAAATPTMMRPDPLELAQAVSYSQTTTADVFWTVPRLVIQSQATNVQHELNDLH